MNNLKKLKNSTIYVLTMWPGTVLSCLGISQIPIHLILKETQTKQKIPL